MSRAEKFPDDIGMIIAVITAVAHDDLASVQERIDEQNREELFILIIGLAKFAEEYISRTLPEGETLADELLKIAVKAYHAPGGEG